jgi:hypothetical protein
VSVWNKESDFYLTVNYDLPECDPALVSKSKTLWVSALIISLLIHGVVILFKPQSGLPISAVTSSWSVDIRLIPQSPSVQKDINENTIIGAAPIIETQPITESHSIELPESEKRIITSNLPDEKTQAVSKPIEWLSAEDYKHISETNDKEFSSQDNLAFNARLKQHRNETRHLPPMSGDRKSIATKRDIHGNQFYEVDGNCFMSLPQNMTSNTQEGRNWYSVACGGKSGSEKMIDNLNREMRARFKNP